MPRSIAAARGWLRFEQLALALLVLAGYGLVHGASPTVVVAGLSAVDLAPWAAAALLPAVASLLSSVDPPEAAQDSPDRTDDSHGRALEGAPVAMLAVDADGRIVLANNELEALLGYPRDELLGLRVEQLLPQPFREGHVAMRRTFVAHPDRRRMGEGRDLCAIRRDGSPLWVEIGLSPVVLAGKPVTLAVVVDISARRQVEERLSQANTRLESHIAERTEALRNSNAELEKFAFVASHDLQEPLRMVASYTELLAQDYQDKLGAEANEYIHFAVDGARRMQRMLNDLLAYSRISSKGGPFVSARIDRLVRTALANLEPALQSLHLEFDIAEQLPDVRVDSGQIIQLLQHLLANAIKFAGKKTPPRIVLSAARDGEWVRFAVRDRGIGFHHNQSERIFEIFQRLHTREEYPGNGIGLSICKRIVHRHGGRIWAEGSPDRGATFYFTVPAVAEADDKGDVDGS